MSVFTARRRAAAIVGVAAAAAAIAAGSAGAYASTTPTKHPVVVPHVPRSLINRALPSAIVPSSRRPEFMTRPDASQDGVVDVGDLGLYYFSSNLGYGSLYDTAHNDNYLFDNHFISAGAGQHQVVGANAEFAWNRDPHTTVIVCTGINYTGSCGVIGPNVYGNFTSTYSNRVESVYWADSSN